MGEFSLSPPAGGRCAPPSSPCAACNGIWGSRNRINTLLVSRAGASRQQTSDPAQTGELAGILRDVYSLEDTDLKLRVLDRQQCLSVETEGTLIGEGLAARVQEAADTLGLRTSLLFTYLANSIRSGGRQIPYSLVTALDFPSFGLPPASPGGEMPPLVLNRWAARDLKARPGDLLELDYYLWAEQGRLLTRSAKFRLSGVVPMEGPLADRDLAPAYPGITESRTLVDWDPPFPMELGRIRPRDESYWEEYRTTPKAFVPLQVGQELWRSRHGQLSSIRVYPTAAAPAVVPETLRDLRSRLESELKRTTDPGQFGFSLRAAGAQAEQASRGVTDFGQYFVYFSFFLVVSALPAHQPFFQAGSGAAGPGDWTASSPGLRSCRNPPAVPQGGSPVGGAGHAGGPGGSRGLHRPHHAGTAHLVGGGRGHHPAGASPLGLFPDRGRSGGNPDRHCICIAWSLRRMVSFSPRSLLTGSWLYQEAGPTAAAPAGSRKSGKRGGGAPARSRPSSRRTRPGRTRTALLLGATALGLLLASLAGGLSQELGFFASGTLCLLALLAWQSGWLRRTRRPILQPQGALGGFPAWGSAMPPSVRAAACCASP